MKYKITCKQVQQNYEIIVSSDFLQHLLLHFSPVAYNAGASWNFDLYDFDDVAICTGYRNIPSNYENFKLEKKYDLMAVKYNDNNVDFDFKKDKAAYNKIMDGFLNEVRKNFYKELEKGR